MTYGAEHGRTVYDDAAYEMGSQAFFDRLDREFYSWNKPLHGARPFDRLFPYQEYQDGKKVLEIGCGLGTLAMNWARNGAEITAVDLNPTSIEQTRRRFDLMELSGRIEPMDARHLAFADASFDYVYSWGVLHHSPQLEQSLGEMMRVLKPGGGFGIMLYNRRSLLVQDPADRGDAALREPVSRPAGTRKPVRRWRASRGQSAHLARDQERAAGHACALQQEPPHQDSRHRPRHGFSLAATGSGPCVAGLGQEAMGAPLWLEPLGLRAQELNKRCAA
jgi:SAM-dependent methyltransferase